MQQNEDHESSTDSQDSSANNLNLSSGNLRIDTGTYKRSPRGSPSPRGGSARPSPRNNSRASSLQSSPHLGPSINPTSHMSAMGGGSSGSLVSAPTTTTSTTTTTTTLSAGGGKLFRKSGNESDVDAMRSTPTGRKLAKHASKYNATGDIDVAEEQKDNEYDYHYGVRDTDSGRIFIVARFEKVQIFGSVDQKTLKERGLAKLQIMPKHTETFPIQIYCATFNCGMCRFLFCFILIFCLFLKVYDSF